ncbi:Hypothetical predicted protein [Octopus vulgaris]|uniref:Radial spoke head protein 3 homolog n=1 Tax=Octopus vulgaris TaxID=6645 RepID=A0AA36EYL4_OCTVU|nr:Hypothetical predicted protein [Octopus vulgaris]
MSVLPQRRAGTDAPPYTFSSQPRVVSHRKKYKEKPLAPAPEEVPMYSNIMYDRRVVRGNTYALSTIPAQSQPDPLEAQRRQEAKRRANARRRAKEQFERLTPEPVPGRKHIDVQTELYLEEISDRVEEADVDIQTDYFLDRPPTPLYVPAKTGIDVATQILDGELFDFNIEVQPILEVLVGKTIEQSLIEVLEEEELANLRKQQRQYIELRNAELAEQQRLEEQNRRKVEEKEMRMLQQVAVMKREKETAEKISAMAFAQSYLRDLVPTVFAILSDNGYFYDPVEKDIEEGFLPWLMQNVNQEVNNSKLICRIADSMIDHVIKERNLAFVRLGERLKQEKELAKIPPEPSGTELEEDQIEESESTEEKSDEPEVMEDDETEEGPEQTLSTVE